MKRTALLLTALFCLCSVVNCCAQSLQKIVLNDNSVIFGRIVEMKNNVYTIDSNTFGTIKIPASKIMQIGPQNGAQPAAPALQPSQKNSGGLSLGNLSNAQSQINAQMQSMLLNEDFMQSIMGLSQNADVLSVLQDEQIMQAISAGDYESLLNNPKIKRLINNPEMKKIIGKFE